jgi:hypothetical protein
MKGYWRIERIKGKGSPADYVACLKGTTGVLVW